MTATTIKNKKRFDSSFIIGFGLPALFLCVCLLLLPVRYETNDDFGNIERLQTHQVISPDKSSPVLSKTLVTVLIALYRTVPDIPWYGIIVYGALFLGVALNYGVLTRSCNPLLLVLISPLFFLFVFHSFVFLSHTTAALLLEFGVFISLLEWVLKKDSPYEKRGYYAVLLTLGLILGYLLRWILVSYFLVFGAPLLLFIHISQLKKIWPFVLAVVVVIFADRGFAAFTVTSEQQQYLTYNSLRADFHDSPEGFFRKEITSKAIEKAGWAPIDFIMYKHWVLYDNVLFNAETLKIFLKENNVDVKSKPVQNALGKMKANYLQSKHHTRVATLVAIIAFIFYFPNFKKTSKNSIIKIGLSWCFFLGLILFFAYYRFPPRIYIPMYIFYLSFLFLSLNIRANNEKRSKSLVVKKSAWIITIFLTLIAYKTAWTQISSSLGLLDHSLNEKNYVNYCLADLKLKIKESSPLIVRMKMTDSLSKEKIHPLKEKTDFTDMFVMPGGTSVNSPRYHQILTMLNLKNGRHFLQWCANNKRVYFVYFARSKKEHEKFISWWDAYYRVRIFPGKNLRFKKVRDYRGKSGSGIIFYQLSVES